MWGYKNIPHFLFVGHIKASPHLNGILYVDLIAYVECFVEASYKLTLQEQRFCCCVSMIEIWCWCWIAKDNDHCGIFWFIPDMGGKMPSSVTGSDRSFMGQVDHSQEWRGSVRSSAGSISGNAHFKRWGQGSNNLFWRGNALSGATEGNSRVIKTYQVYQVVTV